MLYFVTRLATLGALLILGLMYFPSVTWAQAIPSGLNPPPAGVFQGLSDSNLIQAVYNLVNIFLFLVGLVATIYLIYGGVRYIASRGDAGETEAAKNTILYALIGLIVIGLSAAIVRFVVGAIQLA